MRPCHKDSKFCNKFCKRHTNEVKKILARKSTGIKPNENQLKALKKGQQWRKGLTKENCPQIAEQAKTLSKKYKGKAIPQFDKWREFLKTPEGRKQNSERQKKYYAENPEKHPNFILAQKGYETSIEKKMRLALEKKQISFEKQFKIDRFWVDFAVTAHRLVIEADGEYWHDKERDAKRDEIINSHGWRVLRFTETQINKNIEFCIANIQEAISLIAS